MTLPPDVQPSSDGGVATLPLLGGRYRLLEKVGEGGMGVVYSGEHPELQTRVAIKVLQPALADNENARARFMREARLAASIESEHSTRIFDVGVGSEASSSPFIVMEFLVGESLETHISRRGRLSLTETATVGMQVLDVLAEAHSKHLVHRDLKPSNLFLMERPGEAIWTKVMDFGISKRSMSEGTGGKLTIPKTPLGSPEYMSPEQLRDSSSVESSSDIWSFGILLYELLVGVVPFTGATLPEICTRILEGHATPLAERSDIAPIPPVVSELVDACLQKDARKRPKNAYVIAQVLAPFASESGRALLNRIKARCDGGRNTNEGVSIDDDFASRKSRPRIQVGLALIAVAGLIAFAVASLIAPASTTITSATTSTSPLPKVTAEATASAAPIATPLSTVALVLGTGGAPSSPSSTSSATKGTGPRAMPSGQPTSTSPSKPNRPRPSDLDGIDLIQ